MQRKKKIASIEFKLDKVNLIKEISRERIGIVPGTKVIKEKNSKSIKHKKNFHHDEDV